MEIVLETDRALNLGPDIIHENLYKCHAFLNNRADGHRIIHNKIGRK
jgi:hypothetical protein